jgi:hypothetical protein
MTATDLMNGSVHRNVRQRLLLFYHIYGRKPEKNYNTYTKKSHNRNPEKSFKHKIKKAAPVYLPETENTNCMKTVPMI